MSARLAVDVLRCIVQGELATCDTAPAHCFDYLGQRSLLKAKGLIAALRV